MVKINKFKKYINKTACFIFLKKKKKNLKFEIWRILTVLNFFYKSNYSFTILLLLLHSTIFTLKHKQNFYFNKTQNKKFSFLVNKNLILLNFLIFPYFEKINIKNIGFNLLSLQNSFINYNQNSFFMKNFFNLKIKKPFFIFHNLNLRITLFLHSPIKKFNKIFIQNVYQLPILSQCK